MMQIFLHWRQLISMKCQILFSGKSKKNITNLLSAELAQSMVKVNLIVSKNDFLNFLKS